MTNNVELDELEPPSYDELEASIDYNTMNNDHVGDILDESLPPDTTRIYFQNLNGLRWDKEGGKWPYICDVLAGIDVDIACFTETNTDTNNYNVRRKMETIAKRQFEQSQLIMASSKHVTTKMYKPGGTGIMACNAITSSIRSHTRDRMGRWASIRLTTTESRHIRIISAYQVCPEIRPGTNTEASQQRAQLLAEETAAMDLHRRTPREAFVQDLQAFIRQSQNNGDTIILVGDFNEEITTESSGMEQLANNCGLADLFNVRLGTSALPATYHRGPRRIDYALVSPELLNSVQAAGYDPFDYRIPSDHRGFYIDLTSSSIFSEGINPLTPMEKRNFNSKSPGVVEKYVNAKMAYLKDHEFFERLQRLEELQHPDNILAEALDKDFQRAAHHAARVCTKRQQAPWSPQLAEAWASLHFYKIAKTALLLNKDLTTSMVRLQQQWQTTIPRTIPRDNNEILRGYNTALQRLKEARQMAAAKRQEYLEKKAALYETLNDKGKSKIVQRLIRAESQHQVYQKIRYLRNKDNGVIGLSTIKVPKDKTISDTKTMQKLPDTPDHWETINVPNEIERLLQERNRQHFGQAQGTPFTEEPLQAAIGYKADGYAADLILTGNFHHVTGNQATQLLIRHLQQKTTKILCGHITTREVIGKLKHWHEATSTSPSGLHLGHSAYGETLKFMTTMLQKRKY